MWIYDGRGESRRWDIEDVQEGSGRTKFKNKSYHYTHNRPPWTLKFEIDLHVSSGLGCTLAFVQLMLPSYTVCLFCLHQWWKKKSVECGVLYLHVITKRADVWLYLWMLVVHRGYKGGWIAKNSKRVWGWVCLKTIRVSKQQRKWPQRGSLCWIRGNGIQLTLVCSSSAGNWRKVRKREESEIKKEGGWDMERKDRRERGGRRQDK